MPKRIPRAFLTYSRTEPARTIITIIAVFTFLAGIWVMTPFYTPAVLDGPVTAVAFGTSFYIAAIVNCAVCIPAIISAFKGKYNPEMVAKSAWWLFVWYTFVTMTRLVIEGFASLYFLPVAMVAMVLSVLYIEQKHRSKAGL